MNTFVLMYNSGSENEGIHSIELKGKTIVLMFEDKDDATRYCGLLEAQDFPVPSPELISIKEIEMFCMNSGYETRIVKKDFIPKTPEEMLLLNPPSKNLDTDNWQSNNSNSDDLDLNTIKKNLEKLL